MGRALNHVPFLTPFADVMVTQNGVDLIASIAMRNRTHTIDITGIQVLFST